MPDIIAFNPALGCLDASMRLKVAYMAEQAERHIQASIVALIVPAHARPLPGRGVPVRCPHCLRRFMTKEPMAHWTADLCESALEEPYSTTTSPGGS